MATKSRGGSFKQVQAGFDFKKLPGRVRAGSPASYRKVYTEDARAAMAQIIANYNTLINTLKSATPEILLAAMQPVFDKSQEYCPVDTSALVTSGIMFPETDIAGRQSVRIQYGDESAPYAALVHEMVWLNHEPPTRAKYLQQAMEEEIDSFLSSIAIDYAMLMGRT